MIRTLFVDDEADILEGLENRMRGLRKRWRMEFALGASQALKRLDSEGFDVIVTDVRMPGMDGAELLDRVRIAYPDMVRVVLSGQTEREQLLRIMPLAHHMLTKPCEAAAIEAAVDRALRLRKTLEHAGLRDLTAQVQQLPPLSHLYRQVDALVRDPGASVRDVADLISQDVAMTASLLQTVNSGLFGLRCEVGSVRQAAAYLGMDPLRSLVLSIEVERSLGGRLACAGYSLQALQTHSIKTARIASAMLEDEVAAQEAFAACILHDIGSLAMATYARPQLAEGARVATSAEKRRVDAELEVYGFTHAQAGAALLSVWNLPSNIVDAVAHHHHPSQAGSRVFGTVGAVHVADRVAHADPERLKDNALQGVNGLDVEFLEETSSVGAVERLIQRYPEVLAENGP